MNWKYVVGYEGMYQVSDVGDVRSVDRVVAVSGKGYDRQIAKGRVLTKQVSKGGYMRVSLSRGGKQTMKLVHRLVLAAFASDVKNMECRHLDSDPSNNAVGNLAWGTPVENQNDRVANGTSTAGEGNGRAKITDKIAKSIKNRLTNGERVCDIAKSLFVSEHLVSQIKTGKTWGHI